jgi:hypothetical protein
MPKREKHAAMAARGLRAIESYRAELESEPR